MRAKKDGARSGGVAEKAKMSSRGGRGEAGGGFTVFEEFSNPITQQRTNTTLGYSPAQVCEYIRTHTHTPALDTSKTLVSNRSCVTHAPTALLNA